MKHYKLIISIILFVSTSACTVFLGEPSKRVKKFTDIELCIELADKTFKYHPSWSWAISDEIKFRKLDTSERCVSAYNNRNARLMRKIKAIPIPFKDALDYKN